MSLNLSITAAKSVFISANEQISLITTNSDVYRIRLFLNEYRNSKMTYKSYKSIMFRFYLWVYHNKLTLDTLTRTNILAYYNFISDPDPTWFGKSHKYESPKWKPFSKKLSVNSILLHMRIIRQMFSYLFNIDLLEKNILSYPIHQKPITTDQYKSIRILLTSELNLLENYISALPTKSYKQQEVKARISLLFKLLYYTGCRKSELSNARMSDLEITRDQVWINVFGKGNKYGKIPVPIPLLQEIEKYRKFHLLPSLFHRKSIETHIPLIIKSTTKPYQSVSSDWIYQTVKKICHRAANLQVDPVIAYKMQLVSPHWFRHTSATTQLESGIDMRIVQNNLRHSSIQTTLRYLHTSNDYRYFETISKFPRKLIVDNFFS